MCGGAADRSRRCDEPINLIQHARADNRGLHRTCRCMLFKYIFYGQNAEKPTATLSSLGKIRPVLNKKRLPVSMQK